MKNKSFLLVVFLIVILTGNYSLAQFQIDINLDIIHKVGAINSFEREKWITAHASNDENDWNGEEDKLKYLVKDLDVYFGRNTGGLRYQASLIKEDPNRPGFGLLTDFISRGQTVKNNYSSKTNIHAYEKGDIIVASQQIPFYPNGTNAMNTNDPNANNRWFMSQKNTSTEPFGTAMGEFVANFLKYSFGNGTTTGQLTPKYFEVMNEPIWPLVEMNFYGGGNIDNIFTMHNSTADQIHKIVPSVKVGGYTAAFPDHDKNNFSEWETRWKKFIDVCGQKMDFYSFHLYDFPLFGTKPSFRRGGRNEATLDMIQGYNFIKYGTIKPMVISEYGSQTHNVDNNTWTALRDWYHIKSTNNMLMQFLERPDEIARAIPFQVAKAEWGISTINGKSIPYSSRLLRKNSEPAAYTGNTWVWTEFIKFYELWQDVNGLRIDTYSENINLQVDGYVDENNVFVILNNISDKKVDFKLNLLGLGSNAIQSIITKRLYLSGQAPVLQKAESGALPNVISIDTDETIVLKIVLKNKAELNQSSNENKHYSSTYYKPIIKNAPLVFEFGQTFTLSTFGEALLKVGIGRNKASNKKPSLIKVNGIQLTKLPEKLYRGDDQTNRDMFFSMLEIPIDFKILKKTGNIIEIAFDDDGGIVSTVAVHTFNFTREVPRFGNTVNPNFITSTETSSAEDKAFIYPNPSSSTVNLPNVTEWKLYSNIGILLKEGKGNNIDILSLSSGIYLVEIRNKRYKIVKN